MTIRDRMLLALQEIDRAISEGRPERIHPIVERVRRDLDSEQLLTTTEAADLLGIRSINTIKAMARAGEIAYRMVGSHMRIPLSEIERLQHASVTEKARALERLHDETADLGVDEVDDEMLEMIDAGRPRRTPWQQG